MKKLFLASAFVGVLALVMMAFKPATIEMAAEKSITKPSASENFATKWTIDRGHSNVKFTITHMVVSEVDGSFKLFEGTMEHSKPDYSDAKISFSVDVNSIDTDNENRDRHLKSDDFFSAEKYPKMTFESTAFKPLGNNKFKLDGNLTIRDVTKPVSFDVSYGGTINTNRGAKAGFKAKTTINRFDYGLKWDRATETGGLVVSKEVDVTINAELNEVRAQQ